MAQWGLMRTVAWAWARASVSLFVALALILHDPPPFAFPPSRFLVDPLYAPLSGELSARTISCRSSLASYLVGGTLLRNGPNPVRAMSPYHWFDGDGMVVRARFETNQTLTLSSHWLRTPTLAARNATRQPRSFLAELQHPWRAVRALAGLANSTYHGTALGATTANTAFLRYRGRLFALMEAALPLEIDPETLATRGLSTLDGALVGSFTAHPKWDARAGDLVAFGYIPPSSALQYYVLNDGRPLYRSRVDFSDNATSSRLIARMPHDFATTPHWTLWLDVPAVRMHPAVLAGLSGRVDPTPPRLVYHPRRNTSDARWVPVEGGANVFHFVNAWEEDDDDGVVIVLVGFRSEQAEFYLHTDTLALVPWLYEWRVDVRRNTIRERHLRDSHTGARLAGEFPSVHPNAVMQRPAFMWSMALNELAEGTGILKYAFATGRAAYFHFAPHERGQEPAFVPEPDGAEDAGSLVTFVFDRQSLLSSLVVVDAASMVQTASFALGVRVPFGFHTIFLPPPVLEGSREQKK